MYSFGPLPKVGKSGRIIGAHQKIDRVARRNFEDYLEPFFPFPDIKAILKFEGINGPDGVKLKSPGVDEPWHFIDPTDPTDTRLMAYVRDHLHNLEVALRDDNMSRSAFEAAWLAHAVADGLTPAHQTPESETIKILREESAEKQTLRSKLILPSEGSTRTFVKNNWEHWGAGGVMTTHTMFEAGVATTIKALKFEDVKPSSNDIVRLEKEGFETLFHEAISRVYALDMYTAYKKHGWTRKMASLTRRQLMPDIVRTVILAWYAAYQKALTVKKGLR